MFIEVLGLIISQSFKDIFIFLSMDQTTDSLYTKPFMYICLSDMVKKCTPTCSRW